MPIYEYRCQCGASLEALESVGARRERCGELCPHAGRAAPAAITSASLPPPGTGLVERVLSAPGIRGDGHEAQAPSFNPVRRANRPGCDCESDG